MKKLVILTLLAASFTTMYAEIGLNSDYRIEQELGRRYNKRQVSSEDLPSGIRKYLNKSSNDFIA